MRQAVDERALGQSLGQLVDASIELLVGEIEVLRGPDLPSLHGASFVLSTSSGSLRAGVELDRDLAALLVSRVTQRPLRLMDPSRPLDASVTGAVAAIVTAALRKAVANGRAALAPLGSGNLHLTTGERVLRLHLTVLVNDEAFPATVTLPWVHPHSTPGAPASLSELRRLDDMPIRLALIVATATAARAEIETLATGDAWLPGEGWTIRREGSSLTGEIVLGAPASERGVAGKLLSDGALVIGEPRAIPLEIEMREIDGDSDLTTAEAVLDAPVVVRVEMGAVTLTAREWANLAAGDVIALEKRIAEPLTLRVGGLEVARGELVEIEGELGVRILERRGER